MAFGNNTPLLDDATQSRIVQAIGQSEQKTSGEIRVFIESKCGWVDALDRAKEVFFGLKMDATDNRNAVLIYIALVDHQLAVFADENIFHKTQDPHFWNTTIEKLKDGLRQDDLALGLENAIIHIGDLLALHYPYSAIVDKNELPDEIVFGK